MEAFLFLYSTYNTIIMIIIILIRYVNCHVACNKGRHYHLISLRKLKYYCVQG